MLLRTVEPDIKRYLPRFLSTDAGSLKDVLEVHNLEHEKQRQALLDILKQKFISTATWGIEDWERIVDVRPNPGDDIVQRRNRVLLKWQSNLTSTKEFMRTIASRYVTEDSTIQVIEDNPHYSFRITDDAGKILYFDDLWDAVETYKPAHLGWRFVIQRHFLTEIFVGFVHGRIGRGTMLPDTSIVEDPDAFTGKIGLFRVGRSHAGMP